MLIGAPVVSFVPIVPLCVCFFAPVLFLTIVHQLAVQDILSMLTGDKQCLQNTVLQLAQQ